MARTSSITTPSLVGIVRRAPDVDEKVKVSCFLFVTGRQRSHVGTAPRWYCVYSVAIHCSDKREIWRGGECAAFHVHNVQRSTFTIFFLFWP